MHQDHGLVNRTVRAGVYKVGQVLTRHETPLRKFQVWNPMLSADFMIQFARMLGSS